jgi:hypothetical protein
MPNAALARSLVSVNVVLSSESAAGASRVVRMLWIVRAGNQHGETRGRAAQRRRARGADYADDEGLLAPGEVAKSAAEQQQAADDSE